MNPGPSKIVVQGFLKGSLDVFDALLGASFSYDSVDIRDSDEAGVRSALGPGAVCMRGTLKGGGAVVLIFPVRDMANLVSLIDSGSPSSATTLDAAALATLKDIADSTLGGGVSNLSEKFRREVALAKVDVVVAGADGTADLMVLLGEKSVLASYRFKASPHFDAPAAMAFSEVLEQQVPANLAKALFGGEGQGGTVADEPLVSDDEMKDILSGFDASPASSPPARRAPDNLDLVLDIELTATARLGRIEMPIGEILNLGPGSIIEVGQMIDDPVDLYVNDKLIARGDVVVVDEKFGLRITEIVSKVERIESLL